MAKFARRLFVAAPMPELEEPMPTGQLTGARGDSARTQSGRSVIAAGSV
jgi:hypothetical protein